MKNRAYIYCVILFALCLAGNNVIFGSDVKLDKSVAASVNGEELSRDMLANLLIDMYGNEGLDLLIRRTLVKQEAAKSKVSVTEEEIAERIKLLIDGQVRQQMNKGGLKGEEDLNRELEKAGITLEQYRDNIKKMLKVSNGQVKAELLAEKIVEKTIKITEDELKEAYEEQLGEKILARQLVLRTMRDAERILERLKTGADFEALAKKESVDRNSAARGGRMRPFGPNGIIGKSVESLKAGELSEIIKTDSGYHIIKIEKRIPRSTKKFSEVRDELVKLVKAQKVQSRITPWLINIVENSEIIRNLTD